MISLGTLKIQRDDLRFTNIKPIKNFTLFNETYFFMTGLLVELPCLHCLSTWLEEILASVVVSLDLLQVQY